MFSGRTKKEQEQHEKALYLIDQYGGNFYSNQKIRLNEKEIRRKNQEFINRNRKK